jgi:hypothetical protein
LSSYFFKQNKAVRDKRQQGPMLQKTIMQGKLKADAKAKPSAPADNASKSMNGNKSQGKTAPNDDWKGNNQVKQCFPCSPYQLMKARLQSTTAD